MELFVYPTPIMADIQQKTESEEETVIHVDEGQDELPDENDEEIAADELDEDVSLEDLEEMENEEML